MRTKLQTDVPVVINNLKLILLLDSYLVDQTCRYTRGEATRQKRRYISHDSA